MKKEIIWYKLYDSLAEAEKNLQINQHKAFWTDLKKVCLIRTKEGFYATEDACPHMLASLSKGCLTEKQELECPWHKYRFDVRTGKETTGKNIRDVKTFTLEENEKGFCVGLPKEEKKDEFSF